MSFNTDHKNNPPENLGDYFYGRQNILKRGAVQFTSIEIWCGQGAEQSSEMQLSAHSANQKSH